MSASAQQKRAFWLRHLHNWHWISAAICLVAILLFAMTGFTLNHSADIEAHPVVVKKKAIVPTSILSSLKEGVSKNLGGKNSELPVSFVAWLEKEQGVVTSHQLAEWSPEEIYLSLPRPGGDAWLRVALDTGEFEYEKTDRGAIAYLNDLHKGRNTGKVWSWFIDIFAFACLIFCVTGLFLLKMHARSRALTWPLVVAGFVIPLLLAIIFIH